MNEEVYRDILGGLDRWGERDEDKLQASLHLFRISNAESIHYKVVHKCMNKQRGEEMHIQVFLYLHTNTILLPITPYILAFSGYTSLKSMTSLYTP